MGFLPEVGIGERSVSGQEEESHAVKQAGDGSVKYDKSSARSRMAFAVPLKP